MLLQNLSDDELHESTRRVAQKEQAATLVLLEHLQEVERRYLYAKRGCSRLHEYVVSLGYSDAQATERVNAARLMSSIPEVKEKLESHALSLSTACQIQTFFNMEKKKRKKTYSAQDKREVLALCDGKSKRNVQKVLFTISPESAIESKEGQRLISASKTELKLIVSEGTMNTIARLREIQAKQGLSELVEAALGFYWEALEKKRRPKVLGKKSEAPSQLNQGQKQLKTQSPEQLRAQALVQVQQKPETQNPSKEVTLPAAQARNPRSQSRFIPLKTKREVLARDGDQCTYVDPKTGKHCTSRYRPQYDHNKLFCKGGANDPANLRLLCPTHNRLEAIRVLGIPLMAKYLPSLRPVVTPK